MKLVHISGTKTEYLKAKIDELETNIRIKNIRHMYRGINDFKKGYQPNAAPRRSILLCNILHNNIAGCPQTVQYFCAII